MAAIQGRGNAHKTDARASPADRGRAAGGGAQGDLRKEFGRQRMKARNLAVQRASVRCWKKGVHSSTGAMRR